MILSLEEFDVSYAIRSMARRARKEVRDRVADVRARLGLSEREPEVSALSSGERKPWEWDSGAFSGLYVTSMLDGVLIRSVREGPWLHAWARGGGHGKSHRGC